MGSAVDMAPTRDQFLLFGDSITRGSFAQDRGFAFGAALSDIYGHSLDVINRGLSGYNSTQAFQALPLIMPDPAAAQVRLMTFFFGANDARIPDSPGGPDQSVPLDDFIGNLRAMVKHPAVQAHKDIRVILVTTPPIDERKCLEADQQKYPDIGRVLRRTAANTARYAQAVRELGKELDVPVVDIHASMLARAGYNRSGMEERRSSDPSASGASPLSNGQTPTTSSPAPSSTSSRTNGTKFAPGSLDAPESDILQSYLYDGLHFSGEGYKLLYGELMAVIDREFPDQMPTQLPSALPAWDDGKAWDGRDLRALRKTNGH